MAGAQQHHLPRIRHRAQRNIRSHLRPDIFLPHLPPRHPLLGAQPTEIHHSCAAHDPGLRDGIISQHRLLQACRLLPSAARLLRGVCHFQLLHPHVRVCRARTPRAKKVLPQSGACKLGLGCLLHAKMHRRRESRALSEASFWPHLVQRRLGGHLPVLSGARVIHHRFCRSRVLQPVLRALSTPRVCAHLGGLLRGRQCDGGHVLSRAVLHPAEGRVEVVSPSS